MIYPILYSFRRCPYAMRARMAIAYSGVRVELREVVLKDKPPEILLASPKGTVPVLVCDSQSSEEVIEESLEIMFWALSKNDPDKMNVSALTNYLDVPLINENDNVFKAHLDHYKYADRFPENTVQYYREQGEVFLKKLDELLSDNTYLTGEVRSIVDVAIFPFIRQFAFVDKAWFYQSCYLNVRRWLDAFLVSALFLAVMPKFPQWHAGDEMVLFP